MQPTSSQLGSVRYLLAEGCDDMVSMCTHDSLTEAVQLCRPEDRCMISLLILNQARESRGGPLAADQLQKVSFLSSSLTFRIFLAILHHRLPLRQHKKSGIIRTTCSNQHASTRLLQTDNQRQANWICLF